MWESPRKDLLPHQSVWSRKSNIPRERWMFLSIIVCWTEWWRVGIYQFFSVVSKPALFKDDRRDGEPMIDPSQMGGLSLHQHTYTHTHSHSLTHTLIHSHTHTHKHILSHTLTVSTVLIYNTPFVCKRPNSLQQVSWGEPSVNEAMPDYDKLWPMSPHRLNNCTAQSPSKRKQWQIRPKTSCIFRAQIKIKTLI